MFTAETDLTTDYIFASDDDKTLYVHDEEKRSHEKFMDMFIGTSEGLMKKFNKLIGIKESEFEKVLYEERINKSSDKYETINMMGCLSKYHLYNLVSEQACEMTLCVCCGKNLNDLNKSFYDECMCNTCESRLFYNQKDIIKESLE